VYIYPWQRVEILLESASEILLESASEILLESASEILLESTSEILLESASVQVALRLRKFSSKMLTLRGCVRARGMRALSTSKPVQDHIVITGQPPPMVASLICK
jgi:hypothetical protein